MDTDRGYEHYRELQSYVGWSDEDAGRIMAASALLDPHLPPSSTTSTPRSSAIRGRSR